MRIVADPDRALVEIRQQPRKHERGLRIVGFAPFGPPDVYLPAIEDLARRVHVPDVPDENIGLDIRLIGHEHRLRTPCRRAGVEVGGGVDQQAEHPSARPARKWSIGSCTDATTVTPQRAAQALRADRTGGEVCGALICCWRSS